MLPLPPSTERIWIDEWGTRRAYPCRKWFRHWCGDWGGVAEDESTAEAMSGARVYHVPQPAPADKPTILPPAEMPEALRPYWTPESRVYIDWARSVCVYPSQMATIASVGIPFKTVHSEAKVVDKNCTLLPNRTTESILGTASAAKAVEQGVADAVEGRTVEVSVTKTKHEALYDAARRYVESGRYEPDSKIQQDLAEAVRQLTPHRADQAKIPEPLDQLAAEAQAEGEYGTAWERWQAKTTQFQVTRPDILRREFNAFIAAECERAVERAKASQEPVANPNPPCPKCGEPTGRWDKEGRYYCPRPSCRRDGKGVYVFLHQPPTPRRTAREVAEEVAWQQGTDLVCYKIVNGKWGPVDEDRTQTAIREAMLKVAQAAIERDREGR